MILQNPTSAQHQIWLRFTILFCILALSGCSKSNAGKDENAAKSKHMNRLANEQSPYLLQHADNPVDWYPWGNEAFEKAKELDRPIFLSIGYSTCHWCHVMEHESFEDDSVAKLLNENFISVKVDREERPEVDHVYMAVCQAMTGGGGWPLTIFMTPDKEPFFAGTYFPKDKRGQRPGMYQVVPAIADAWKNKREDILASKERIISYVRETNKTSVGDTLPNSVLESGYTYFKDQFDDKNGGFGKSPKFPSPHNLIYLIRYADLSGDTLALSMAEQTLKAMRNGGIFDQLGFGFHRYSTDSHWRVPHFEKMLYDQALLTLAYLEAYSATGDKEYERIIRETLTYITRDMTDPQGGFYSAEDADSEGEEGKFYIWSAEEIQNILGAEDGRRFMSIYNMTPKGNFRDEATQEQNGNNILFLRESRKKIARFHNMTEEELDDFFHYTRSVLLNERNARIHPLKDDKILTDWNGLMIAAMAKAGAVLNDQDYVERAEKAAEFILEYLRADDGSLFKRSRNGKAGLHGHLDDYAFLSWGLIELYEATFEPRYLEEAVRTANKMVADFWDKENGALFLGRLGDEDLIVRSKTGYDGAIPSGNSVAAMNFLKLGRMTGNTEWLDHAETIFKTFSKSIVKHPRGFTQLLSAFLFQSNNPIECVIVGNVNDNKVMDAVKEIRGTYNPNKVLILKNPDDSVLEKIAPWTKSQNQIDGKTTFYICENFACNQPTTDIKTAIGFLNE